MNELLFLDYPDQMLNEDEDLTELVQALALYEKHLEDSEE